MANKCVNTRFEGLTTQKPPLKGGCTSVHALTARLWSSTASREKSPSNSSSTGRSMMVSMSMLTTRWYCVSVYAYSRSISSAPQQPLFLTFSRRCCPWMSSTENGSCLSSTRQPIAARASLLLCDTRSPTSATKSDGYSLLAVACTRDSINTAGPSSHCGVESCVMATMYATVGRSATTAGWRAPCAATAITTHSSASATRRDMAQTTGASRWQSSTATT
mmetsp:Transcript_15791/g.40407  ORF Transcript_15791/g.40407 Transcript_15791/m.40407 type:complete len:220 (+) Transcript_15791:698-1357(+)